MLSTCGRYFWIVWTYLHTLFRRKINFARDFRILYGNYLHWYANRVVCGEGRPIAEENVN